MTLLYSSFRVNLADQDNLGKLDFQDLQYVQLAVSLGKKNHTFKSGIKSVKNPRLHLHNLYVIDKCTFLKQDNIKDLCSVSPIS